MKYLITVLFLYIGINLCAQNSQSIQEGTVSYITNGQVYVKFPTTDEIEVGDTLFLKNNKLLIAALTVKNKSSISCVCEPVYGVEVKLSQSVFFKQKLIVNDVNEIIESIENAAIQTKITSPKAPESNKTEVYKKQESNVGGRLAVSSYTNFSNSPSNNSQRMRYTFSMNADNIGGSKLSSETYISFAHKSGKWDEIQEDIFNGLKIYNLSVNYRFNKNHSLWLGRKINPKISQIGASDGLQYEASFKQFTTGVVFGSRPDNTNYSFNPKFGQLGVYLSHEKPVKKGNVQSSIAFIEQRNNGFTDRRFIYLQHTNTIIPKVYFFGSVDFDLFKKVGEVESNQFQLTNAFFSIRYKVIKPLSLAFSYSTRQNIIFYETYKTIIDQLLESEATQGYQFHANYRAFKKMALGFRAGYRFQKTDLRPSKNLYAYLNYSQLPLINAGATISATLLETSYLKGNIYSAGLTRDFLKGKMFGSLTYRNVSYTYFSGETTLGQNLIELGLSHRIQKKLILSLNVESTIEKTYNYNRIYLNLTQRF